MTTSGGSNASPSSQPIPITSLPIPELRGLREKLDMEVQRLQSSKIQLSRVLNAFHASNTAVHRLSKSKQGDSMLVPLTGSLYVNGDVASVQSVLVDIGTGYFVERSINEASDYCLRKTTYLSKNISQLDQALMEKQKALSTITRVLESRMESSEG